MTHTIGDETKRKRKRTFPSPLISMACRMCFLYILKSSSLGNAWRVHITTSSISAASRKPELSLSSSVNLLVARWTKSLRAIIMEKSLPNSSTSSLPSLLPSSRRMILVLTCSALSPILLPKYFMVHSATPTSSLFSRKPLLSKSSSLKRALARALVTIWWRATISFRSFCTSALAVSPRGVITSLHVRSKWTTSSLTNERALESPALAPAPIFFSLRVVLVAPVTKDFLRLNEVLERYAKASS